MRESFKIAYQDHILSTEVQTSNKDKGISASANIKMVFYCLDQSRSPKRDIMYQVGVKDVNCIQSISIFRHYNVRIRIQRYRFTYIKREKYNNDLTIESCKNQEIKHEAYLTK